MICHVCREDSIVPLGVFRDQVFVCGYCKWDDTKHIQDTLLQEQSPQKGVLLRVFMHHKTDEINRQFTAIHDH